MGVCSGSPQNATWMFDAGNRAIIHINSTDCPRTFDREVQPGSLTGALHHVALKCVGYEEVKGRLDAMGASAEQVLELLNMELGRRAF